MQTRCRHEDCPRVPRFAPPGQKPTHCIEHKTYSMTDKTCAALGCANPPRTGWLSWWSGHYCEAHVPE